MIIATAGHVDHGKTLLVRALTGVDTDRLPEEKRRGLSIELGFAYLATAGPDAIGFVDVPGHERFVATMLAGVAGVDHVLLVVAADDGPMPQTVEHLAIIDLMEVRAGTVVISKIDRVGPDRVAEVGRQVQALVAGSSIAAAPLFPVSALDGRGIDALRHHIAALAESGRARSHDGHFRLAIDRRFTVAGAGLVVTGTVFAGRVRVGDRVVVSPGGRAARVRGLHAQNRDAGDGGLGQRLALNLTGPDVSRDTVRRGAWVVDSGIDAPSRRLDAIVRRSHLGGQPLRHGGRVHVHLGAAEVLGRLDLLEGRVPDPASSVLVQLVLDEPIGALHGDRVVLRDRAARVTIAGGRVLDPFAPARGRGTPLRLARLRALAIDDPADRLRAVLAVATDGVDLGELARAWNMTAAAWADVERRVDLLIARSGNDRLGMDGHAWTALRGALLAALPAAGLPLAGLRRALGRAVPEALVAMALDRLALDGAMVREGSLYRTAGQATNPDLGESPLWVRMVAVYDGADLKVPVVVDLAAAVGCATGAAEQLLVRAEKAGLVQRVARNRFVPVGLLSRLETIAETLTAENPAGFATAAFRDRAGVGRNLAIEVLEYFDRAGVTRRRDDRRTFARRLDRFGIAD